MPQFELEQGSFRSQAVSDAQGRANRNQKSTTAPPPPGSHLSALCTRWKVAKYRSPMTSSPGHQSGPQAPYPWGPASAPAAAAAVAVAVALAAQRQMTPDELAGRPLASPMHD